MFFFSFLFLISKWLVQHHHGHPTINFTRQDVPTLIRDGIYWYHVHTLISPVFLSSSYLTLLPFVISTTCVVPSIKTHWKHLKFFWRTKKKKKTETRFDGKRNPKDGMEKCYFQSIINGKVTPTKVNGKGQKLLSRMIRHCNLLSLHSKLQC